MRSFAIFLVGTAFLAAGAHAQEGAAPAAQEAAVEATPAATAEAPATVPEAQPAVPSTPAADVVEGIVPAPPKGKGQVVFFRKGGFVGSAISCAVHENGAKLTRLPPGKYHVHVAEPGIHEYSVRSEATDTLRLEVEPDETYFAQCTITMGIMAGRPNLSPTDQATFFGMSAKLKPAINKPEKEEAASGN